MCVSCVNTHLEGPLDTLLAPLLAHNVVTNSIWVLLLLGSDCLEDVRDELVYAA